MGDYFYQFKAKTRRISHWASQEKPLLVLFALTFFAVTVHMACRTERRSFNPHGPSSAVRKASTSLSPAFFIHWRERFLKLHAECDNTGLVRGIFLGEDAFISEQTKELFHRAGLMHLLAASGFNCWLVAFFFLTMAKLGIYFLMPYVRSKTFLCMRIWAPPLCMTGGAWLFWLWSDQSAPITRSVVLMSAKFVFWLAWWRVPFARLLLVQYLISLCFVPRLWRSASFQLTFGCLFGLVYFPKFAKHLKARFLSQRVSRKLELYPRLNAAAGWLWLYTVTNLGACLGTIPTTYIVFGEINFSSLLTNWFSTPYASAVLMPLAFFSMLTLVIPGAEHWWINQKTAILNAWTAGVFEQALCLLMNYVPSLLYTG